MTVQSRFFEQQVLFLDAIEPVPRVGDLGFHSVFEALAEFLRAGPDLAAVDEFVVGGLARYGFDG